MTLYERLRTRAVLHRAWMKVRASGFSSSSESTVSNTRAFDVNWVSNLERISKQLLHKRFSFSGEKGITPPKKKGSPGVRPIVIAPVANRIVRRAILEVMQGYGEDGARPRWHGIPSIRQIMETKTSVGGIPKRGVPHGLALINDAVKSGNSWFVRSDIRNFFTKIPQRAVVDFVRAAVDDTDFVDTFQAALATNLTNQSELEDRKTFLLFPSAEIGVAQGSAISALAGNIALRGFDEQMNARRVTCVRYIDDFILIGPTHSKVLKAYESARKTLHNMGMSVYDLDDHAARKDGKVDHGNIHSGTDILGYRVSGQALQPCAAAKRKLLEKIDEIVRNAKSEIWSAVEQKSSSHHQRFHQSMVLIHKTIWGWSQSFKYTTTRHVFSQLDAEIDKRIAHLKTEMLKAVPAGNISAERRASGIHLLMDTELFSLEELVEK